MKVHDITNLYPKLLDIAMYHNATQEEAEDVVQDLFVKLKEIEIKEGSIDRLTYKGKINMVYLFNSIRNRVYNQKRYSNKFICIADISPMESHAHSLAQSEIDDQLVKMGSYYHKLYHAYFNDNISMRKLAEETNISLTTIYYGLRHIKNTLKPIFE